MPSPHSEEYRTQVQTRIQDLLSGNRPRDPHLGTISTRQLILEGVVEEVRIYRLHKQEQARKEKEVRKRMSGHGTDRSRSRDRERRKHRHHHGEKDGKGNGRGHKHGSGERHKHRHHDEESWKHRDRSGEGERRHHRRHRSRDGNRGRSHRRDIPGPVTEGSPDPNPELMMSGGAGPAGTRPRANKSPPRSRSRSRPRHPRPGRAGASRSPTRRHGPDGRTPFGQLPKKTAGVGIVTHALHTYKHIKAEHDAGHRSRGSLERTVDGWRGKKPSASNTGGDEKRRESEKLKRGDPKRIDDERSRRKDHERREDDRGRREKRRSDGEWRGRGRHKDQEGLRGDAMPHGVDRRSDRNLSRRPQTPYTPRNLSPHQVPSSAQVPYHPPPGTSPPCASHDDLYSRPSSPTSVHIQAATPPAHQNEATAWPPTPKSFKLRSCTASPMTQDRSVPQSRLASPIRKERSISRERFESQLASERPPSHTCSPSLSEQGRPASRSRSPSRSPSLPYPESTSDRSISPIQMPPPPSNSVIPPPPTPPLMPKATPNHAALFGQIQGGAPKLRKVHSSEKKDKSAVASAGHVYEETPHSHDIEERERGQASMRAWSDVGTDDEREDGETESQRIRNTKRDFGGKTIADEIEARYRK